MRRSLTALASLLLVAVAGCNGAVGMGTPSAPGGVAAPSQPNPAASLSDAQATGDVAEYYLQRMAYTRIDGRVERRVVALNEYERSVAATPAPLPSPFAPAVTADAGPNGGDALPNTAVPLPALVPSFVAQSLQPPAFPSDDAPARKLAEQDGVTLKRRTVDAKGATQAPVDRIDIERGTARWRIDVLTGLVTFEQRHSTSVIEHGAERAHEVAVAFLERYGGIPSGAVEVDPVYAMTRGERTTPPRPTSITFVWRHDDPTVIGADAITVTVTPSGPALGATPAPDSGLEVTGYMRLWRKAGAALAAGNTPPMTARQALAALARSGRLRTNAKVTAVVFGGLRAAAASAPLRTRPAWAFRAGDAWYAVDALDGAVSGSAALGVPADAIAMTAPTKPAADAVAR